MTTLQNEHAQRLRGTATALVARPKGILAADESPGTMSQRLEGVGVEPTATARRDYREMLLTTPELASSLSGVILADETFQQRFSDGRSVPQACAEAALLIGIKVDTGAKPLALSPGETVTEGLDGLRERLGDYAGRGASFAKWRAALTLDASLPSAGAISVNAHALARYAALCQEAGLVPIVEPELLMDGDHDLQRCAAATADVLDAVFLALLLQGVDLAGIVLKPNMVLAGTDLSKHQWPRPPPRPWQCCSSTCLNRCPGSPFSPGDSRPSWQRRTWLLFPPWTCRGSSHSRSDVPSSTRRCGLGQVIPTSGKLAKARWPNGCGPTPAPGPLPVPSQVRGGRRLARSCRYRGAR